MTKILIFNYFASPSPVSLAAPFRLRNARSVVFSQAPDIRSPLFQNSRPLRVESQFGAANVAFTHPPHSILGLIYAKLISQGLRPYPRTIRCAVWIRSEWYNSLPHLVPPTHVSVSARR